MKIGSKTMENDHLTRIFQPTKPHFFKPLLPGYLSQLNIPSGFFLKYLSAQKKYEQAVLRTSRGKWEVKIEGQKFVYGWASFARENNLDIGDLLVFKLEGSMLFDVTVFDPSACEKVDSQANVNHIIKHRASFPEKSVKEKLTYTNSMERSGITRSGHPYFISTIKRDCLIRHRLSIPNKFARENGLDADGEIVLKDEKQRSWTLGLKKNGRQAGFSRGWQKFLKENDLKAGDSVMFQLIRKGKKPIANFVLTS